MTDSRDRRRGVPASAPAWLHELDRVITDAEATSLHGDDLDALRDAAKRLSALAGLRSGPVPPQQAALDRFYTMLAAATMAATGAAAAELDSPYMWAAGKNLGVMLCAAAAVQRPRE